MATSDLVTFLKRRADENLRGVARFRGNETDVLYLRDDLQKNRIQSQIDRMINRLRPESSSREEQSFPFGDLYVTVRRFEEAIIMHFPLGKDRGVVVALEPETARDLNTFTSECLERIDSP